VKCAGGLTQHSVPGHGLNLAPRPSGGVTLFSSCNFDIKIFIKLLRLAL